MFHAVYITEKAKFLMHNCCFEASLEAILYIAGLSDEVKGN